MSRLKRLHRARRASEAPAPSPPVAPPGSPLRWRDVLSVPSSVFGLVLLLFAAGCPVQLARWEAEDRRFVAEGRQVDGVVVDRWTHRTRNTSREYLEYEFRGPDGQAVHGTSDVPSHLGDAPIGSRLTIEYLPIAPASHRPYVPSANPDVLRPMTLFWCSALPAAAGLLLVRRGWRQARNQRDHGTPFPDLRVRDPDVLFDAGRQLRKVRFLMWLSIAMCAGGLLGAWSIAVPVSGDAPTAGSIVGGGFVGLLALAFSGGMWMYARHYVAEWREVPGTNEIVLRFPGLVGCSTRRYRAADVQLGGSHAGRAVSASADAPFAPGITVEAPWHSVRVPDRRWPLILDGQGWFRDIVKP